MKHYLNFLKNTISFFIFIFQRKRQKIVNEQLKLIGGAFTSYIKESESRIKIISIVFIY